MHPALKIVMNAQDLKILIAKNVPIIGLWLEENAKLYQTSFSWNNPFWKINSQELTDGFLIKTKEEDKLTNAVANQWSEVLILWVLVLVQPRLLMSHHTKDLDSNPQSTKSTLGMENS